MCSFPNLEPICCSLSGSWPVYRFLRRQVRWSGIHISWRIFQFVVIHKVKGFSIVNEAEIDVFLEFPCFSYDSTDVEKLNSGFSAFSKSTLYLWKFSAHVLLMPHLMDWSIIFLACEMSAVVQKFEHSFALPFFVIGTYLVSVIRGQK